jgi:anti-sigma regulatory factor (Ser/Thr protein kinase)
MTAQAAGTLRCEISLPNDARFLHAARAFVGEVAQMALFPPEDVEALVHAADEACTNAIQHAFEPGESGTYTLSVELSPDALSIGVREQGIPYVEWAEKQPPGEAAPHGLGFVFIRRAADSVCWVNLGKGGKELRFVKRRPQADVTADVPASDLKPFGQDEPAAPEQAYTIRRFEPADATKIAQCIFRVYGYTYPSEDLYFPERLVHMNESGKLISAVALDARGDVVGHYALERPRLGPVAESGQAVVAPQHRGRRLMERMRTFLEQEAARAGLVGLYGQPVTSHTFSQKVNEDFGSVPCGVTLGLVPRSFTYKKTDIPPLDQRESTMLYFKYLRPPRGAAICAPERHRAILGKIYAALKVPAEFLEPSPPEGRGEVEVTFDRAWGFGAVRVNRVGADTASVITLAGHDLTAIAGAEAVYLELPLSQRGTAAACEAAETSGFSFGGVGPSCLGDGDALRLQMLAAPLDTGRLKVFNPFGQELLAYVAAERARVGGRIGEHREGTS